MSPSASLPPSHSTLRLSIVEIVPILLAPGPSVALAISSPNQVWEEWERLIRATLPKGTKTSSSHQIRQTAHDWKAWGTECLETLTRLDHHERECWSQLARIVPFGHRAGRLYQQEASSTRRSGYSTSQPQGLLQTLKCLLQRVKCHLGKVDLRLRGNRWSRRQGGRDRDQLFRSARDTKEKTELEQVKWRAR
jgi:hypothetical protein